MPNKAMGTALRSDGMQSERKEDLQTLRPVVIRKGPRRAQAKASAVEDAKVAPWFDAAVKMYGKAQALAEELGIGEAELSEMRVGHRSIALRRLLPLLGHTEAILALVGPLLESISHVARPVNAPTFAQLAGAVLADLDDGSSVTRALIERAAEKRGWNEEQVALALRNEEQSK